MISRVLGLIRDHFQAVFFGTGPIAVAWEIAYMLPNMLRNLLAEGSLSQAFIPLYSESLKQSEEEAKRAAGIVIVVLTIIVSIIVFAGIIVFPYIIPFYTGKTFEEAQLTILLSQIMFAFILTSSITAIFAGMENTHQYFVVPALSPILLNIVLIGGFLFLLPFSYAGETNAIYLAFSVLAGGLIQLAFQAYYVYRKGLWPQFSLNFRHPVIIKILTLMGPAVLGASIFQINQLLDIAIASYLIEDIRAVPALRFSQRLIQLPTGIIGVALSTAILPSLVRAIRRGEEKENEKELVSVISFALFLTVPAAIGLYVLGPDIINLIYYGGQWKADSTEATWMALQFYCIGVPFYSLNKILTSSFYAYQDTKTPVRILVITVFMNLCLNVILAPHYAQAGLAISSSITGLINALLLLFLLRNKIKFSFVSLWKRMLVLFPLWVLLAFFAALTIYLFEPFRESTGLMIASFFHSNAVARYSAVLPVLIAAAGGGLLYLGVAYLLKIKEMDAIRSIVKRKSS